MADSPSHRFGQIIGDILETAVEPILQEFAEKYNLYLDKKGPRAARRGLKASWFDLRNNKHDLDFVLEKNGSVSQIGIPVAFIETAWRRYTKHSRNKAQEIQGAILPLVEKYQNYAPFYGTILAGVFTDNALTQLRSLGFAVLFFPYDTIIQAFKQVEIDAFFDESTPDRDFSEKVAQWEALSPEQKATAAQALIEINIKEVSNFLKRLETSINRQIEIVRILPLYGASFNTNSIDEAISFLETYSEASNMANEFVRYEIEIRFINGDSINTQFKEKARVIEFLKINQPKAKVP